MTNFVIAGILGASISTLISIAFQPSSSMASLAALPVALGVGVVGVILASGIQPGILHLASKLLGGKGRFRDLYYLISLFVVPLAILAPIPYVNILAGLYGLYLMFLAVREAESLSAAKALGAMLLGAILVAIVFGAAIAMGVLWYFGAV